MLREAGNKQRKDWFVANSELKDWKCLSSRLISGHFNISKSQNATLTWYASYFQNTSEDHKAEPGASLATPRSII